MMANLIEQIQTPAADSGDSGFQFNYNFSFDTNGLWIEILNTNGVTTNLWLRLHNTVGGDNYQLLSTTNLVNHGWDLGQILTASAHHGFLARSHHQLNGLLQGASGQSSDVD